MGGPLPQILSPVGLIHDGLRNRRRGPADVREGVGRVRNVLTGRYRGPEAAGSKGIRPGNPYALSPTNPRSPRIPFLRLVGEGDFACL